MDRGKQVVKNQIGGAIPLGLIASFAGSLLGEIAKPIFKKKVGGRRPRRRRRRIAVW